MLYIGIYTLAGREAIISGEGEGTNPLLYTGGGGIAKEEGNALTKRGV